MIPIIVLTSMLLSAPPPPPDQIEASVTCRNGKIVAVEVEAPAAGTIKIEIPPDVCDHAEKPTAGPPSTSI